MDTNEPCVALRIVERHFPSQSDASFGSAWLQGQEATTSGSGYCRLALIQHRRLLEGVRQLQYGHISVRRPNNL